MKNLFPKKTVSKWQNRLPMGYYLKVVPNTDHWFVDGVAGYCVAHGKTPQEAVLKALSEIRRHQEKCNSKPKVPHMCKA